jgi:hypothetical protein
VSSTCLNELSVAIQTVDTLAAYIGSVMLDGLAAERPNDRCEETTK